MTDRLPMTDREIARFVARRGLFIRRGMAEPQADDLCDVLALRDQQKDDRRCCIECSNWQRGSERTGPSCMRADQERRARCDAKDRGEKLAAPHALAPIIPMPVLMQRCAAFQWQTP